MFCPQPTGMGGEIEMPFTMAGKIRGLFATLPEIVNAI
jgi:hypothetical protein